MSILSQQKQSQNTDFPNIRPSLDLRFALAKKLDPRITFTRGSTGTYFGPDGLMRTAGVNEPRFDHDPITGQSLGLMIEETRTNLFTRSDVEGSIGSTPTSFVVPYTSQGQSVVVSTDVFLGPNGQSAKHTKGVQQNDTNTGYVSFSGLSVGQTYCCSIWLYIHPSQAKNFSGKYITFQAESTPSSTNISTASYNTNLVGVWQRAFCVFTAGNTVVGVVPRTNAVAGSFFYTDCWQLEVGSFPTSYMPASGGSQFIRSDDNASMTGTNFSSWYNQSEGTFISNCITRRSDTGNPADFAVLNSTNTSRIVGWFNNNKVPLFSVFQSNFTSFLPTTNAPSNQSNVPVKKAISLAERTMRVATQGKLITGDLGTGQDNLPTDFNRMLIGYEGIFAGYLGGTISRLTYYPIQITNQQLINLTN